MDWIEEHPLRLKKSRTFSAVSTLIRGPSTMEKSGLQIACSDAWRWIRSRSGYHGISRYKKWRNRE
ncbi:MAG TPA: hypothetical protein VEM15_17015 [Thermodesulfobacteriota bacterium]|nr:hypothetical protein [Thermodesulfobacteriota bacterium]